MYGNRRLVINIESICKLMILLYLCSIYAFSTFRIYIEVVLILVLILYLVQKKKSFSVYFLWSVAFIGICGLSNIWTIDPQSTLLATRGLLEIAIVGNLLIAFVDSEEKLKSLLKYFVFAGICSVIRLMVTTPISLWGTERLGNELYNSNNLGMQLSVAAICLLSIIISSKRVNVVNYILFAVFFVVTILTGSRKAFVFFVLGCLIVYFLNIKRKYILTIILPLVIIFLYLIIPYLMAMPLFYEILGRRIEGLLNLLSGSGRVDNSALLRMSMIERGIEFWRIRPLLGYGMNSYTLIGGFGKYAHNNYVELLVGVGLIGTVVYYSIYIFIIKNLFKLLYSGNKLVIPFFTMVILLVISEVGLVSYGSEFYQIILVIGVSCIKITKKSLNNSTV